MCWASWLMPSPPVLAELRRRMARPSEPWSNPGVIPMDDVQYKAREILNGLTAVDVHLGIEHGWQVC